MNEKPQLQAKAQQLLEQLSADVAAAIEAVHETNRFVLLARDRIRRNPDLCLDYLNRAEGETLEAARTLGQLGPRIADELRPMLVRRGKLDAETEALRRQVAAMEEANALMRGALAALGQPAEPRLLPFRRGEGQA